MRTIILALFIAALAFGQGGQVPSGIPLSSGVGGATGPTGPAGATGATGPTGASAGLLSSLVTCDTACLRAWGDGLGSGTAVTLVTGVANKTIVVDSVSTEYIYGTQTFSSPLTVLNEVLSAYYAVSNTSISGFSVPIYNLAEGAVANTPSCSETFQTAPCTTTANRFLKSNTVGNSVLSKFTNWTYNLGSLLTATPSAGLIGVGYAPGDTGTVDASCSNVNPASAGNYVIGTVDGMGGVLTLTVSGGTGFAPDSLSAQCSTTATTGIGTGLQVDPITITPIGDGSLKITTFYHLIP